MLQLKLCVVVEPRAMVEEIPGRKTWCRAPPYVERSTATPAHGLTATMQPQLYPALLRLSASTSQYFTRI